MITIDEGLYKQLIIDMIFAEALLGANVDQWSYYYDSLDAYAMNILGDSTKGYEDMNEVVDYFMENLQTIWQNASQIEENQQ